MRGKAAALLLSFAVLAPIGAGCGSNNAQIRKNNAYVDQVNSAQRAFSRAESTISGLITPTSTPATDAASLNALASALDATITSFRSATPPAGVASLHQQLTGELQSYAAAVRAAGAKVAGETPASENATLQKLGTSITAITRQFNATVDAINRKLKAA